jgi:hypothetical protein
MALTYPYLFNDRLNKEREREREREGERGNVHYF